ncbi:dnaJ-like protein 60 isoform X2 [Halyomorpha halys]|uniref:dnaJ-like protein 60 isoform X2 n=1 Tax=Halyomorpha halys TaxID=286706 RepID=UPI0006D4FE64|nr:dnaJ-like protein 60 isoform X2 [Halyomorpha halys]
MNCNLCVFANRCHRNYWFPLTTFRRFFSQSYYDVLKVSPSCSTKEIREAFLLLSKQTHPDKHLNDPSMHEKFVRLNEAYSTLINPSSRRAYDMTLYNERKLNPPYCRPFSHTYSGRKTTYDSYQSSRSSQSTNAGYYKDPFSWESKARTDSKYGQHFTSGMDGVKKISNTVIVGCLLAITVVGAIIQILAIRRSFMLNQEKMLERSHQVSLLHKQARERAKLYGNAHQIEVLKKNLDNVDPKKNINEGKNPILQSNEKYDKPKGGKTGECAIHGSPAYCAVHRRVKDDPNIVSHPEAGNNPVHSCKRCKKCGHSSH